MPGPNKQKLQVHPLIAGLKQDDERPQSVIRFAGYVGQSAKEGVVRLYSSLDDLSHYLEFDEKAVLESAPASESVLPHNAVCIFLSANAPVRWVREYPNARALRRSIMRRLGNASARGSANALRSRRAGARTPRVV
jgi:hypothetical protein